MRTALSLDDLRAANLGWLPDNIPTLLSPVSNRRWPGSKLSFSDSSKTDFNKVLLKHPVLLTRLHARFSAKGFPGQIKITYAGSDKRPKTGRKSKTPLPTRSAMNFSVHRLREIGFSQDRAQVTARRPVGDVLRDSCSGIYWRKFTPFLDQRAAHNVAEFTGAKLRTAIETTQPAGECPIPLKPELGETNSD